MSEEPNRVKRIFSGSLWGILARVLDALVKFFTIPLLVGFYGKADYGLITLAFSLNAYLRLMDMGFNVGAVRFFSMWIEKREWDRIGKVSRSSIIFYGAIGIVNALLFIIMAHHGQHLFTMTDAQVVIYRQMMYVLAFSAIFNWLNNVVIQLLSAKDELGYVNRVVILSSVLNFAIALVAIAWQLPLITYFIGYTLAILAPVPLYVRRLRVYGLPLRFLLLPKWDGPAFKEIWMYSLAIFAMGIFQLTANDLRPLLLGRYATGMEVLTDYRVMQTIASLILTFGGVFLQVLLPSASKIYAGGDQQQIMRMVYGATKYISIFLAFMVFVLILNAERILVLYMGEGYESLSLWLSLWLLTVLLSMHNTPVASLVLSSGKTRFLVYSSATACIVSLPITVVFAERLQVGAAVVGYMVYMILQIGFYYLYYIPKILKLDSWHLFINAFAPAAFGGVLALLFSHYLSQQLALPSNFFGVVANSAIFLAIYTGYLRLFVVKAVDIHYLREKLLGKGKENA